MKKFTLMLVLFAGIIMSQKADAQVGVRLNVGIGTSNYPSWLPSGYESAQYYYLPDIDAYYDVMARQYVYFEDGQWIYAYSLPGYYSGFDFFTAYKVRINEERPWLRNEFYSSRYASYRSRQYQVYRDAYARAYNERNRRFEQERNDSRDRELNNQREQNNRYEQHNSYSYNAPRQTERFNEGRADQHEKYNAPSQQVTVGRDGRGDNFARSNKPAQPARGMEHMPISNNNNGWHNSNDAHDRRK